MLGIKFILFVTYYCISANLWGDTGDFHETRDIKRFEGCSLIVTQFSGVQLNPSQSLNHVIIDRPRVKVIAKNLNPVFMPWLTCGPICVICRTENDDFLSKFFLGELLECICCGWCWKLCH